MKLLATVASLLLAGSAVAHDHANHGFTEVAMVSNNHDETRGLPFNAYRQLYSLYDANGAQIGGPLDISLDRSYQSIKIYRDLFRRPPLMGENEPGRQAHVTTARIPIGMIAPPDGTAAQIPPAGEPTTGTGWVWLSDYQCDFAWHWDIDVTEDPNYPWAGVDSPPANCYLFAGGEYVGIVRMPWLDPIDGAARINEVWRNTIRKLGEMGPLVTYSRDVGSLVSYRQPLGPTYFGMPTSNEATAVQQADLTNDGAVGGSDFTAFANLFGERVEGATLPNPLPDPDPATWVQP